MSTLFWFVATFGLSTVLIVGAILVFGWPVIVGTKLGRMLLAAGGALLFVVTVFLKGRAEGEKVVKKQQEKVDEKFIDDEAKYRDELSHLSDDELDRLLLDKRSKSG